MTLQNESGPAVLPKSVVFGSVLLFIALIALTFKLLLVFMLFLLAVVGGLLLPPMLLLRNFSSSAGVFLAWQIYAGSPKWSFSSLGEIRFCYCKLPVI